MRTVFVTVGTTSFDELVEDITSPEAVEVSGLLSQTSVSVKVKQRTNLTNLGRLRCHVSTKVSSNSLEAIETIGATKQSFLKMIN